MYEQQTNIVPPQQAMLPKVTFDGFPYWGPSFDPAKYSTRSSARSESPAQPTRKPQLECATVTKDSTRMEKAIPSPQPKVDAEATTLFRSMSTCSIPDQRTSTSTLTIAASHHKSKVAGIDSAGIEDLKLVVETPKSERTETSDTLRLASLRRIKKIHNVKVNQRWLTLAVVDGWVSLVPDRAFKEDELVLYLEIDSFLPASDDRFGKWSALQMTSGKLGHRVKTRQFGSGEHKIVVQGYVYPVEKFAEIYDQVKIIRQVLAMSPNAKPSDYLMNDIILAMYRNENWADKLGIRKWEEAPQAAQPLGHPKLGSIPTRLFKKTDITRLEDCPNLFSKAKYNNFEYQESVKMDGCSMTVYFVPSRSRLFADLNPLPAKFGPNTVLENGRFGVCSKNFDLNELAECPSGYWKAALQHDLPAKLSKHDRSIAIQGELCGHNINRNREKIPSGQVQFFVFAMYDIAAQMYINPRRVETLAEQFGLQHVPVVGYVKIPEVAKSHHDLKKRAMQRLGEGLVYKCVNDGRAFKVISSTYLLEHGL